MEENALETDVETIYDRPNVSESEKQDVLTADELYRDLDERHLAFKYNLDELEDLQSAVYECVSYLLDKVQTFHSRFKRKELILVGSFKDGTKIISPDEFDFLVVIDELSKPGVIKSVRCGEELQGYMTLQITDKNIQALWLDYCKDGYLHGFVVGSKNKKFKGFSSLFDQLYKYQCEKRQPISIKRPCGTLQFDGAYTYGDPNAVLILKWRSKFRDDGIKITVDISPAVRCYNLTEAVNPSDCVHTDFYTKIREHGSYLLTCARGKPGDPTKYFRISLTEVEVDIVQSLDPTHRTCYRALKYIVTKNLCAPEPFPFNVRFPVYSTYVLKSAVLHHVANGQCQSSNIHTCVMSLLSSLLTFLTSGSQNMIPFMPSVFIKGQNLFEKFNDCERLLSTREIVNVCTLRAFLFIKKGKEDDHASTIQMLETGILDLLNVHHKQSETVVEKIVENEITTFMNSPSYSNYLYIKFGVPCKLF